MKLSQEIKTKALELGFCKAGITDSDDIEFYQQVLEQRAEDYLPWINGRMFSSDPKSEMSDCQSVIVLAYDYGNISYPPELTRYIGRAYLSRTYIPREDSVPGKRLDLFEEYLRGLGLKVKRASLNIPLRQLARKAGVASFGKNNFAYVDKVGSFVILYAFLVDAKMEYDEAQPMTKCPPNCHRCMDACPTKAIIEPFHLKPSRCVGYNNWMRRIDGDEKFGTTVPKEIRPLLGTRIHGCDECQAACPRNMVRLKEKLPVDPYLEYLKDKIKPEEILFMDEDYYRQYIYPVMYNYIRDYRIFRRNAAIAMGNSGEQRYLPYLRKALEVEDDMLREHVQWAIDQLECQSGDGDE